MEEMKAEERRRAIAKTLTAEHPVSATALAGQFSVSRQIIVGDIALLRAAGLDIVATPRGYKLGETTGLLRAVACVHSAQETPPCPPSPMGFIFTTSAAPVRRRTSGSART